MSCDMSRRAIQSTSLQAAASRDEDFSWFGLHGLPELLPSIKCGVHHSQGITLRALP